MAWIVLLVTITGLLLGDSPAQARTWRVAEDGTGDFRTIQPAVDWSSPGDTIFIAAGRYTDADTTTAYGPLPRVACVVVWVDSLTFIGEGAESVVIGPAVYEYWNYGPVGLGAVDGLSYMRVEGLGFTNNYDHIYKVGGFIEAFQCRATSTGYGVVAIDALGGTISNCVFESCISGVALYSCRDISLRENRFINCGRQSGGTAASSAMTSTDVHHYDCIFEGGFVAVGYSYSSGEMHRCQVSATTGNSVDLFGPSVNVLMEDCVIRHGPRALSVDAGATLSGHRNVFEGSDSQHETMFLRQGTVTLRDCHLLNGGGWTVELGDDSRWNPGTYDLTGNWWGTTDSDQIAAWIYDANDNINVGTVVQYVPFLDHPVGTERRTLGGIKGMFR